MDNIVHDIRETWTDEEWNKYYEFIADTECDNSNNNSKKD